MIWGFVYESYVEPSQNPAAKYAVGQPVSSEVVTGPRYRVHRALESGCLRAGFRLRPGVTAAGPYWWCQTAEALILTSLLCKTWP